MIIKMDKWRIEKIVAFCVFVFGFFMSYLIPVWQTPDEYTHLNMIGESISVEGFADKIMESLGIEDGRIEFNYDEKVDLEAQKNALSQEPLYEKEEMLPQGVSISIIRHLPATVGIVLGIALGIPSYWVLQLGELFSLIFYIFIIYNALKIMPIKKELMAFIILFPMAIQQAGSINYDAVLIPLCFLFISYIFYLKFRDDPVGIKELLLITLNWIVISYIKMPYAFLIFLVFLIPLEKIDVKLGRIKIDEQFIKRARIPSLIIISILLIGLAYLFRKNLWVQIVYGFVVEWRRGCYLLVETGKTWGEFLGISTVGNFGWLDTPMTLGAVILVFLSTFFWAVFKDSKKKMRIFDYIVLIGVIFSLCLFTTLALANHTIMVTLFGDELANETYNIRTALYQIPYIGGLQGRYYLPFVCLFFIPLPGKIELKDTRKKIIFIGMEIVLYIYIFCLLIQRYWSM